ncbi:lycopene cyclase domain-containing protein [Candidatus Kaiserbacteria bacterium]|nr:lycopene cyclase domain-containing protein [Candidatus Kaiserbacteria bacterium]
MRLRRYYYALSLLFVFGIPAAITGYLVWDHIYLPQFLVFLGVILMLGTAYDLWAARHGKRDPVWIWTFNHKNTLGIRIYDLPIEEYIFYLASSIYIVFLWEGIKIAVQSDGDTIGKTLPLIALWSVGGVVWLYIFKEKNDKVR